MRPLAEPRAALFAVGRAIAASDPAMAADAALAEIGPRFDADRAWLIRLDAKQTQFWVAHEWCADGVAAFLPELPGVPIDLIALPLLRLRRGLPVVYPDIEKLPVRAQGLKEEMRREGNRATGGAPLLRDGRLVAFVGLDDVRKLHRWRATEMELLGQLGELVLAAADRRLTALQVSATPPLAAPDGCYLRTGNSHVHVRWDEIVTIRAEGDYTRVELTGRREFHELKSLAIWEAMLPKHEFGRIHRSWIVGWRHLQRLQRSSGGRWTLYLRGRDLPLPVGRHYHATTRRRINVRG